jgi:4a-hydroxytetrahydrobiopterin dehydratase
LGRIADHAIRRRGIFTFDGFSEAFAFMARSAPAAEKLGRHPEWNVYRTVEVKLNTHEACGLRRFDFELARHMSVYASCARWPVSPHSG